MVETYISTGGPGPDLPVVYMHHLSFKSLTDTGHAIADHLDGHARGEVQTEEYAVEERNRGAE